MKCEISMCWIFPWPVWNFDSFCSSSQIHLHCMLENWVPIGLLISNRCEVATHFFCRSWKELRMDAVVAAVRPKQHGTYSQDFTPASYDILLTEFMPANSERTIKCLPKTRLSYEEEAADSLCAFLHQLTGGDLGGLKGTKLNHEWLYRSSKVFFKLIILLYAGKRAVFIPAAENEPVHSGDYSSGISGTLYCVAVDSRGKF